MAGAIRAGSAIGPRLIVRRPITARPPIDPRPTGRPPIARPGAIVLPPIVPRPAIALAAGTAATTARPIDTEAMLRTPANSRVPACEP